MNPHHQSATAEHYAPPPIVDASREVMGAIDLDPASHLEANHYIGASHFFTAEENGLKQRWVGNVFLNPPGGIVDKDGRRCFRGKDGKTGCTATGECGLPPGHKHEGVDSSAVVWWRKLAREYTRGEVLQGIFVGFSIEILQATQADAPKDLPLPLDFPICYPAKRLRFLVELGGGLVPGTSPTHASCLIHLPPRQDPRGERFREVFSKFGRCTP